MCTEETLQRVENDSSFLFGCCARKRTWRVRGQADLLNTDVGLGDECGLAWMLFKDDGFMHGEVGLKSTRIDKTNEPVHRALRRIVDEQPYGNQLCRNQNRHR
jgi:hypothetical protein